MYMGENSNKKILNFRNLILKLPVCLKKLKLAAIREIEIEIKVGALNGHG